MARRRTVRSQWTDVVVFQLQNGDCVEIVVEGDEKSKTTRTSGLSTWTNGP